MTGINPCFTPITPIELDYLPSALIVDFRTIFWTFSPRTSPLSYLYEDDHLFSREAFRQFLNTVTIQDIVEAVLINNRGQDASPSCVWDMIESKCPDGLERLDTDNNNFEMLDFLISLIMENVYELIIEVTRSNGIPTSDSYDYYFHQWVTPTAAILTHDLFDTRV